MLNITVEKSEGVKGRGTPVDLHGEAASAIDKIAARTGLKKVEVVNRMGAWLGDQDEMTQLMILRIATPSPDLIELVLRRMAESPKPAHNRLAGERPLRREPQPIANLDVKVVR